MTETGESVLFVHAHPDDESIATGGTIATLVDRGSAVTVLTCTRGELGEVVDEELAPIASTPEELGRLREDEISQAMDVLGVTDHRFLGADGARWSDGPARRYLDSGMQWGADGAEATDEVAATALTAAPFGEVAADIASVIAEVQPTAVVSYNAWGGYGHPDHIRVHEASRRAAEVMGVPFYAIEPRGSGAPVTLSVDVSPVIVRKRTALAAYRSQLTIDGESFAGANGVREAIERVESYRHLPPEVEVVDSSFRGQSLGVKIFTVIVALLMGGMAGLVLTAVHQSVVAVGDAVVPWAAIVGLVATAALLAGLRIVFDSRIVPAFAAVGELVLIAVLSAPVSGGSVLVAANMPGYIWTYGAPAIVFLVLAWPRIRRAGTGKIASLPAVKGSSIQ